MVTKHGAIIEKNAFAKPTFYLPHVHQIWMNIKVGAEN